MRIALMIGTLGLGGAETQTARLACELAKEGHEVTLYCLGNGGPVEALVDPALVAIRRLGYRGLVTRNESGSFRPWKVFRELKKIVQLSRELKRDHVDVFHAVLHWSYVLGLPAAAAAGVPVRVSSRRNIHVPARWPRANQTLSRVSNHFAHALLANCEAVRRDVTTREHVSPSRITVIPNGVDLSDRLAEPGREPPTGVIVANLIRYKGHDDLVRALARLDHPPVMRLIGDGPEAGRLRRLVHDCALESTVVFEGARMDARAALSDCQFAVLASHEEGSPNAVLEAMAAGLPVVATAVGGVPELVKDGVSGYLVTPGDVAELADRIHALATDARLRERLGAAARVSAKELSWARNRAAHVSVYERVLAGVHSR